ncbi:MAG TPA: FHA domain-containing protein [Streptosporangiaceae bacterium]|nr:FHA domain-containing protein [Streptosporangiaceae bacterium]
MTAGPTAGAENPAPGVADGSLASALSTVDTQATQRLTTLGLVYQSRQSRLIRSAASITAQQGSDSAQATAAEAAVATAKMTAARLAVVQQQVTTAAPTVAASGWALHGRVYTDQLESAVGYCVFLVDAQNAYYSPTGFAYTDSTGYHQLIYPGTATQPGEAQPDAAAQPPALYVEITNPNGQPVYLSTTALAPALGTATYQSFTLSPGGQPIGDPPSQVRSIAFPPPVAAEPAAPQDAKPAAPEHASSTVPIKTGSAVPTTPPLRVRVTNSVDEGRSFVLDPGELTIGREEGSAIQLQDGGVSHNHALLRVHGEDVTIEDLRSTNGTKVNGVAIDRQTNLAPGDLIDVGGVQLVVEHNQMTGPDES